MADMQDSAAEVGRALRDRKYESEPDRRRRELAAERAKGPASVPRSKRFANYKRNSRIEAEAAQGERDVEAQASGKAKARK